ncbi:MAG TPA: response regulator [Candidatus Nitrosotenuis sp.]|nr:response regulator [Candidatus Nitrosotenuis sp.]
MIRAAIIDDDKDTVGVFAEYLRLLGVDVVAVGYDGKQAVEIYKKYTPDILFLDILMPEYDGIYGLREIRAMNPQANVVIITADINKDTEDRLEGLRPTEIIFKPFEMDKLKEMLDGLTKQKSNDFITTDAKKALVSFTITETLLELSPSAASQVGDRLYAKYGCYFSDCLEHPEYLKDILGELFGTGSSSIIMMIREKLEKLQDQRPISKFLSDLAK